MLTEEEEKFISYWEQNRLKEKTFFRQLSAGLPFGLLIGIAILLNFITGWYTRAIMVANGQSTPLVLVFAIILIVFFCTIFFKRHQWDMREQRFLELKFKQQQESQKSCEQVQQDTQINSQLNDQIS